MIKRIKQHLPATIIFLIILVLGARYLFSDTMSTYPAYVHAWTQSDRLALAMNFQENGFDLFHPATYNLLTKDGITQVDFPIHDYTIAVLSNLLGTEIVSTFRWYNLVYSLVGLFFFFQFSLLYTKSALRSIWASIFLFTLPFFVYYQNGFLPSAPSFANFLIGIYFLQNAKMNKHKGHYGWGIFFLSIAAMARAPFLIFLIAEVGFQIILQLQRKKLQPIRIVLPTLGIVTFISYTFYNKHLGETYGSMFLTEFLYFKSFNHFIETLGVALERWGDQILSPFHAVLYLLLLIVGVVQYSKRGIRKWSRYSLLTYFLISLLGVLFFFFAFGQQFGEHDYYYIDSFLPLLSISLILLLSKVEIPKQWYTPIATLCGIFFFYFFSFAKNNQKERYTPPYNDRTEYAYEVYKSAKEDLKNWGVNTSDTLYVIEANSTNIPFTIWGNKGYTNLNSSGKYIHSELDSAFTYAVLLDSFFTSTTFKDYPEIIHRLKRVNSNGELTLYQKQKKGDPKQFFENLIYYGHSNFDDQHSLANYSTNGMPKKGIKKEFGESIQIEASREFSLTVKDTLNQLIEGKDIEVLFLADYFQNDTTDIQIVCTVNKYYETFYTLNQLKRVKDWNHKVLRYRIPNTYFKKGDELKFYFWNPKKEELFVDNFKLIIYQ